MAVLKMLAEVIFAEKLLQGITFPKSMRFAEVMDPLIAVVIGDDTLRDSFSGPREFKAAIATSVPRVGASR